MSVGPTFDYARVCSRRHKEGGDMQIVKTGEFWIGVAVGVIAVPWVLDHARARVAAASTSHRTSR